jgi:hypothetical protein
MSGLYIAALSRKLLYLRPGGDVNAQLPNLSELQATVVLDLQISRSSEYERERILVERDRLRAELD